MHVLRTWCGGDSCKDKGTEKSDFQGLGCCKRDEFAVHEEAFESTFLTAGAQLKVRTLFIVDIEGFHSTSWTQVTFDFVHH